MQQARGLHIHRTISCLAPPHIWTSAPVFEGIVIFCKAFADRSPWPILIVLASCVLISRPTFVTQALIVQFDEIDYRYTVQCYPRT